jgi:inosine/xanthosine triphosphate pyrophosphatase family protein
MLRKNGEEFFEEGERKGKIYFVQKGAYPFGWDVIFEFTITKH